MRWRRLVLLDQLDLGGFDARHHVDELVDLDDLDDLDDPDGGSDDDHDQEAGRPSPHGAGPHGDDHDHPLRPPARDHDPGGPGHHHVSAQADRHGPEAGGRSAQDDADHQQPSDYHHRPPGLHQHQSGVLGTGAESSLTRGQVDLQNLSIELEIRDRGRACTPHMRGLTRSRVRV